MDIKTVDEANLVTGDYVSLVATVLGMFHRLNTKDNIDEMLQSIEPGAIIEHLSENEIRLQLKESSTFYIQMFIDVQGNVVENISMLGYPVSAFKKKRLSQRKAAIYKMFMAISEDTRQDMKITPEGRLQIKNKDAIFTCGVKNGADGNPYIFTWCTLLSKYEQYCS